MTARQRSWLLPPAALSLVAGVFLGRITPELLWPATASVLAALSVLLLKGRGRFAACLVLALSLGCLSGSVSFHPSVPPEGDYEIRGIISDEVTSGSFGQVRVYLSDVSLNGHPLSGGAYWTFYPETEIPDLLPGQQVSFSAALYHPRGADNPDGYNFRESLLQHGVIAGLAGCSNLVVRPAVSFSYAGTIASVRHNISSSLISVLGEETGAYASALLLGMRSMIPSADRQAFSRLGIAHILSVSGFHVGVLVGALAVLFRLLRLRQGFRLFIYIIILAVYSALCGSSQPVIRASLLLVLSLEGRILNRPRSGIHLLSAALLVMTLFSPVQVTSASFQLTFGAMFGLVWFLPLLRRIQPFRGRITGRIFESLLLTFGVQLGLLLPELFFFQRLPLLVFLINLPAMLISGVLITVFWLVLLLLPFPSVAGWLSGPLSAVTGTLLSGIRHLGSLPGLTLWIHTPTLLTAFGLCLVFGGVCAFLRIRFSLRAACILLGSALLVFSLLPLPHSTTEYIQLSDGDADTAVLWDRDKVYVLDTGEDDSVLSSFLRKRRLTPDAVILTHLHADHAAGLRSLINDEIPVRLLMLPVGAEKQLIHPDFIILLEELRNAGTEIRFLSRGDVLPLPSGTLTVLWPEDGKVRSSQDANHYSLVSRICLNGSVLLQTGDITGTYESYCAAPADILKAAHHGSRSSTSAEFLETVSPDVVLVSCRRNSRLQDFRIRLGTLPVFGTSESGAVTVRFDENGYTVIPFLSD